MALFLHLLLLTLRTFLVLQVLNVSAAGFPEECGIFDGTQFGVASNIYSKATGPTLSSHHLRDLPGFTRSFYRRDHALITPESHVFASLPSWVRTTAAHLISPAAGSHFAMYLAKMEENSISGPPAVDVERFFFILRGELVLYSPSEGSWNLSADSFGYLPPNFEHSLQSDSSATLVVFERRYGKVMDKEPKLIVGSTDTQTVLETPGEVFVLRKLLPTSAEYDFNIHVMDFQPGEYLNVKEVHYNQHGLLMLEGQGIYRLGDHWFPVAAGDVIFMAPFVPQWYGALGKSRTRYLLYKDVNRDPLFHFKYD